MKNLAIALLTSTAIFAVPAFAKTKRVTVVKPTSTTVVEQHTDGKITTITSTPDGFTIRDGMPFVPTSVVVTPTYSRILTPTVTTTTVTPAAAPNTILNTVDANGLPTTTVIKPTAVVSTTTTPMVTPVIPVVTTPVITAPAVVVTP